ncbi:MAG: cadherin-like domain-containing protein [Terasakiella sp.]|uniref:cadherin-like domain-containing protein n=1 Tax=unclassified Terasakiella TaxID=2614952 RepID=UPI003AFF8422
MEQNQGTKSSIEMFDLDTGANDQGLSDKVVVINNFEIEQESDLTLQATHIASDKSQAPGEQSISTGSRLLEQDETNNIQHLKVNIPSEDLSSAAQAGKFGLLSLDLSKYADDDNKQIILRNLPQGVESSAGYIQEDGSIIINSSNAGEIYLAVNPQQTTVNIQLEIDIVLNIENGKGPIDEEPDQNSAPVATEDASLEVNEDGTLTITQADLLENVTDADGDQLTAFDLQMDGGKLTDNGDGTWTFEPNADFNGDINLTYKVTDGESSTTVEGTIEVAAVNDAAVVSEDTSFTMNEDGSITISEDQLLANASDVDGDTLSVQNLAADGGSLTDNGNGTWTFEPAADFNGSIDLSYDVSDGTTTTAAGGTIEVAAINDAAVVSEDTSFTMNEDGSITISEDQLLANASDVDGDTLSVQNLSVDGGSLTDNGDGTWTFEPAADFNGSIDLSYDVSDGTTTTAAGGTIEVAAINDAAVVSEDTSFTMNEDGSITISEDQLLANASDVDGDTLSVQNLSVDGGSLTDNGDGTWTFEPAADFNGSIDLSYDVSDGTTTTAAGGTIEVAAINDAAVVSEDTSFAMNEDGTITISKDQLLANASDVDGDTLSVQNLAADGGSLTDNGDGTWTFEPAADFNGSIDLSYDVSDGTTTTAAGGTIEVAAINDAAVVSEDTSFTMNEDGSITISEDQLLANASDVDGDTLSVQNLAADGGSLTDNGDGTWTFEPAADFNGSIDLSYDVSDGTTTTAAGGTIEVAAVNDAAVVSEDTSFAMNEDGTITISEDQLLANASDVDGDTLSVQNLAADGGSLTDNGDGTWTFEPAADFNGSIDLSYDVSDGTTTTTAAGTIEVAAINDAAVVSEDTSFAMNEDGTITISEDQLLANASDVDGDTLSVQNLSADGGTLTDNGDGTWTFEPAADFNGSIDLSYDVSDGTTTTAAGGTIEVAAINDAAVVSEDTSFTMNEDGSITISEDQLLANASDVDGDTLSVQNLAADGGTLTDNGNGTWTFEPAADFNGSIDLSYDVSDGTTTTAAGGTIEVAAVNDAAVVSEDTSFTMNEDGSITISEDQLLANASDVDGDTLSVQNLSVDGGTLTDNGNGTWTFEPAADFNGSIDLSYDVSDGTTTTAAGGTIEVAAINDAAVVSEDTSFTMNEDGSITISEDQLLANASDVDGDTLSVQNLAADGGSLTDNGNGTWTFEPAADFNGSIDLSYDVSDGTTTTAAGGTIEVAAVNDAAVVSEDTSFTMNEDGSITISEDQLLANASDVDGDTLSVQNLSVDGGTLTDNGNGTWTFEPAADFNGSIDLSYDVSDGTTTTAAGGTIEVAAVNDAAVVSEDTSFTMNEDGSITISEDQLLANASDVDGDTLSVQNLAADGGTLTDNGNGTWTFEPAADFNGSIDLSYDVSDGTTTTAAGGTIEVAAVNDAAVVSEDTSFTMNEDGSITISEDQLLANASDVDGDTLSVQNLSVDGGTLTDNGNGTWTFEPAADFNGSIDLSYDVSDGTTTTAAGGTIEVAAINDAAVVSEDTSFTMNEDGSITISEDQLLANASDVDGDTLSVQNLAADGGSLTDNGNGTWTFEPAADFNGSIDLSYDVSDGTTTTAAGGTIEVAAVNDAAVVSEDTSFTMNEDGSITISEDQLLANASDVDGDTLSVQNLSVDGGTLTDNGNGTWTFEPAADFNGSIDLSYDVSDGTTTTAAGGTIEVAAVNDAAVVSEDTSFTMNEDGSITISEDQLLANASDVDGDTLSVQNLAADGGSLTDNGDGTWTFEPAADFNGSIDLSYDVSDGTTTTAAGGTIEVAAINDAAVVSEDTSFAMNEDGTITISKDQLLANASDVDGDTLSVQNLAADGGSLTDNGDGTWTFEPAADFNGSIDLSYDVSDGTTTTAAGGTIEVAAINDAAVVSEDTSFTMNEDGSITISEDQLLANASDVDGDTLSVQNLAADGGSLTDNGNGTWTFEPAADFNGSIDLSYDVSDGTTTTAAAGTIEVAAVADAPELSITIGEPSAVIIPGTQGETTTVFSTSFGNTENGFQTGQVDGWGTDSDAIEVWNDDQDHSDYSGDGAYVELNDDARDHYDDATSINRTIDTVEDATYNIEFDYSGRPGFDDNVNAIEVRINGQTVAEFSHDNSNGSDTNWQDGSFSFTGTGEPMTIEFVSVGDAQDYGRGMYLDNIDATQTLPDDPDQTFIDYPLDLSAELTDTDGSETMSDITLNDIPDNATLYVNGEEVSVSEGSVTISPDDLANVVLRLPEGHSEFDLSASVTSTDGDDSATSTARTTVAAPDEADAPSLDLEIGEPSTIILGAEAGETTTVFSTSFGEASSGFHSSAVDGWDTNSDSIEVWNQSRYNNDYSGEGAYVELNDDARNHYDDATSINRTIDTVEDATYNIEFDYSGRPGFDDNVNAIEVRINGQTVAEFSHDNSNGSDNNWQDGSFSFTGTGEPMTIEFVSVGDAQDYGRGMYLDNIDATQTLPDDPGETFVDYPVNLSAELTDTDGSETLSDVTLSDIPEGAVLLVDGQEVTITAGSANISADNLGDVVLRLPENHGEFNLSASVTASEGSDTATTSVSANIEAHETEAPEEPVVVEPEVPQSNIEAENENTDNSAYREFDEAKDDMGGKKAFTKNSGGGKDDDMDAHSKDWKTNGKEMYEGKGGDDRVGDANDNYGDDLMSGGSGNDRVYGGSGNDVMYGDNGDNLDAATDNNTDGNDTLDGGSGNDEIYGEGGNDVLDGGSGDDFLVGGSGDDQLTGDSGTDTLHGGSGDDTLEGGSGNDELVGGSGADTLMGDGGDDKLVGGSGNDTIYGDDRNSTDWGNDDIDGGAGNDTLFGGRGSDDISGGDGNDVLDAGNDWSSNTLDGGAGNDTFYGGAGNDTMIGGEGDDLFYFGEGSGDDVVHGGDSGAEGWMDTVYLENEDGSSVAEHEWSLDLENGSVEEQADGYIELSDDASGTITFSDGSELTFEGIERFEW